MVSGQEVQALDAVGGHFTILNGNCGDWSCKEDISGQSCADAKIIMIEIIYWVDFLKTPH